MPRKCRADARCHFQCAAGCTSTSAVKPTWQMPGTAPFMSGYATLGGRTEPSVYVAKRQQVAEQFTSTPRLDHAGCRLAGCVGTAVA